MLPILRVLINNDTIQNWVDRQIEARVPNVKLPEQASKLPRHWQIAHNIADLGERHA